MPEQWHSCAMPRVRVSTTVDGDLLAEVRRLRRGVNDATLLDEALLALKASCRATEIDEAYAAYDEHPLGEQDAWGDVESFRDATDS